MSINTKIVKVNDSYSVTMCANGYVVEITGRDSQENWSTAKIICTSMAELITLLGEIDSMDKENS
jgi:hypothetical protein